MEANMRRRDFMQYAAGAAFGVGGLVSAGLSPALAQASESDEHVGGIYRLQAAFHRAKTTQDIDLMMSLWDPDGVLMVQGDANSPYSGFDRIRSFWLGSGSFTHRRFSLVPSFKIQIDAHGSRAWLYFECHDVGNFDLADRAIAADTFLAGRIRRVEDRWVFVEMTAGRAFPLSVDTYFFP